MQDPQEVLALRTFLKGFTCNLTLESFFRADQSKKTPCMFITEFRQNSTNLILGFTFQTRTTSLMLCKEGWKNIFWLRSFEQPTSIAALQPQLTSSVHTSMSSKGPTRRSTSSTALGEVLFQDHCPWQLFCR